jgi:hypothetical protein
MNAITKLTAAALGAMSIAGGVALAQAPSAEDPNDGRTATANYGTPPGAPLKRDGSLSADPVVKTTTPAATVGDTSSTTRTTTTTTNYDNPPAAAPVVTEPVAATPAPSYTATDNTSTTYTKPRADRN